MTSTTRGSQWSNFPAYPVGSRVAVTTLVPYTLFERLKHAWRYVWRHERPPAMLTETSFRLVLGSYTLKEAKR